MAPLDNVAQSPIQPGEDSKNVKNKSNPLHISSLLLIFIYQSDKKCSGVSDMQHLCLHCQS